MKSKDSLNKLIIRNLKNDEWHSTGTFLFMYFESIETAALNQLRQNKLFPIVHAVSIFLMKQAAI